MQDDRPERDTDTVTIEVDAALLADARRAGVDVARVLDRALRAERAASTGATLSEREARWRNENRLAIAAVNAELSRNGLWCDDVRAW